MESGSQWRKWDLHIHCSHDVLNNQFDGVGTEEKMENYLKELEQSELEVIGLTNYFCINGYEQIMECKAQGKIPNIKTILPNIEFRLSQPNRQDDSINIHVIFSDELGVEKIRKFLDRLALVSTDSEGRQLFCSESDLRSVGYDKALTEFSCLKNTLDRNFVHMKDYLIFGVCRGHGTCRPQRDEGRGESLAIEIDKRSDAFFGNENDVGFFLDSGRYEGAFPKPVVLGSDAHDLDVIGSKFTWVKSKPTFEGLKQILYEPVERVRIQSENPESRKNIYTLSSIEINDSYINDELSIKEQFIPLNSNLIAVTGGKGDGKTALLDLLANCFEDRCKRNDETKADKNSFVQRIEDEKADLGIEIGFVGKDIERFSKTLTEDKLFQDSRITYLPQGKIEEYSGDRQRLNEKVEEVIFDNKEIMEAGYKKLFDRLKNERAGLVNEIDKTNTGIYKLEEETTQEITANIQGQKQIQAGQLKDKQDELRELTESMEENIKEKIENIKNQEIWLRARSSKLADIEAGLGELKESLENPQNIFGEIMEAINSLNSDSLEPLLLFTVGLKHQSDLGKENISEELRKEFDNNGISLSQNAVASIEQQDNEWRITCEDNKKIYSVRKANDKLTICEPTMDLAIPQLDFTPQLNTIKEAQGLIPEKTKVIAEQIKTKGLQLEQLSGAEKAQADSLKEIDVIEKEIGIWGDKLKELNEKKERIKVIEKERIDRYHDLLSKYWGLKHHYDKVIGVFSSGQGEIMSGVSFKSNIDFDMDRFVKHGSDILDMRSINMSDIEEYAEDLGKIITEDGYAVFAERFKKFLQRVSGRKESLKRDRTSYDFYGWIFGDYWSLNTEILFNGIPMDKLSMGQKGTVLLKLFLAEGDYPLIIDQPEESLDNKFIYDELVGAFRDAKKKRQIILATNNANLIVNTDAEQVIVAEFKDNEISYQLGALEDLEIREKIMPILEGGEKAFKERERKYGI